MISTPQNLAGVRITLIKLVGLTFVVCELEIGPDMQSSPGQSPGSAGLPTILDSDLFIGGGPSGRRRFLERCR